MNRGITPLYTPVTSAPCDGFVARGNTFASPVFRSTKVLPQATFATQKATKVAQKEILLTQCVTTLARLPYR